MKHHLFFLLLPALLGTTFFPCYAVKFNFEFVIAKASNLPLAKLQLWLLSVAVQGCALGFCAGLCSYAFVQINLGQALHRIPLEAALPLVVLIAILSLYLWASNRGSALLPEKIAEIEIAHTPLLVYAAVFVAAAAVLGIFLVRLELLTTNPGIERLLRLESLANTFLFIAALILSLGTLGTAILRSTINEDKGSNCFPPEYVIAYGTVFALFLIIAYVPVKASLWSYGNALAETIMKHPPASGHELVSWLEDSAKLRQSLNLDLTSPSALLGPISALLPLLSGWIAVLLSDKPK